MSQRGWVAAGAPVLLAVALALSFLPSYGEGAEFGRVVLWNVALAVATALVLVVASWLIVRPPTQRIVVGGVLVIWAAFFGTIRLVIGPLTGFAPGAMLAVWTGIIGLVVFLVRSRRPPSNDVTRGVVIAFIALLLMNAVPAVQRIARSAPVAEATPWSNTRSAERPDVYLVVVDKYSRADHLAREYGVDIAPFIDSLTALGFVVPARARTNYAHTQLTLAALLNGRLVHDELHAGGGDVWTAATALIDESVRWRELAERGYRMVFVPSGFPATQQYSGTDLAIVPPAPPTVRRGETWILNTPLDLFVPKLCRGDACVTQGGFPFPIDDAATLEWKLTQVAALPDSAGPIAALMHFQGMHEPYVFNADCSHRDPWWPASDVGADSSAIREAYAVQVTCVNRLLLRAVRSLLERSSVPPVILLQADHGHGRISRDPIRGITLTLTEATDAQVAERLEVFAAYLFPGSTRTVYDSITPANVLPTVLEALFGTSHVRSPDQAFWSSFQQPLDLTAVAARSYSPSR